MLTLIPWGLATDRIGERLVLLVGLGALRRALLVGAASRTRFWPLLALLLARAGALGRERAVGERPRGHALVPAAAARPRARHPADGDPARAASCVSLALPPIVRAGGVRLGLRDARASPASLGAASAALVLREGPQVEPRAIESSRAPLRDRAHLAALASAARS